MIFYKANSVFLLSNLQSKFNFLLIVTGQIVQLVLEHWSTDQSRVAMDLTSWTRLFEGCRLALIQG